MMPSASLSSIVSALQTAVSPVILISGIGLLLLTMTNRLGRAIDRARSLASADGSVRPEVKIQVEVLVRRARLLRRAILFATTSALSAALLVIFLFIAVLCEVSLSGLIGALFIACMAALIISLVLFMRDVNLSLEALFAKLKS